MIECSQRLIGPRKSGETTHSIVKKGRYRRITFIMRVSGLIYAIMRFFFTNVLLKLTVKINVEISGRGASCGQLHS